MTRAVSDFDTLAARALNATRATHMPTYAGLRVLLRSLAKDKPAFDAFLARRRASRTGWRYFGFQILKEATKGKKPLYRNCVIGSPLTALMEAHVLNLMSREPAFAVPRGAFSYLWPTEPMAGRNFEYYFEGYDRRNRLVGEFLRASPDSVAVVADIKSYYPSVDKGRLKSKVEARCRAVADPEVGRVVRQFAGDLIDLRTPKTEGIPIGPDLSHALGHVALEAVDVALEGAFGTRYLRYVDDMIIVCPKADVPRAVGLLQDALAREGLVLNKDKQDEVDAVAWDAENVSVAPTAVSASFESLTEDITHYLIRHPNRAEELQRAFRDEGFSLPIGRLRAQSASKRFRAHFQHKLSRVGRLFAWFSGLFTTPAYLIAQARSVRDALLAEATRLAAVRTPTSPTRRRWYVQKRRYLLNRLLYLYSPTDYGRILSVTPDIDEFYEYRVVAESLTSRDCTQALELPGRVVTTICQLWPEHSAGSQPRIAWPASPGRAAAEAAAHLALSLSVVPPVGFMGALDKHTPGGRLLVEVCGPGSVNRSRIEALSYMDEMDLLYETVPHEELLRLVTSRFDELEEVGLEGLLLGGLGYRLPGDFPSYPQ